MGASSEESVYVRLREIGCCKLCCLRFLKVHAPEDYKRPEDTLKKKNLSWREDTAENPAKLKKRNVCVACLGLLQEEERNDFVDKIISEVNAADYDCKEFTCALSLPVSFSLRAHSLSLYVSEQLPSEYKEDPDSYLTSVKDVWKWIVPGAISKGIGKTFNISSDCDFSLNINLKYDDDEKECACLLDMHPETYKMREKMKRRFKAEEKFTRKSVEALLLSTPSDHFKNFYPCPPTIPNVAATFSSVSLQHDSIFVAGRYNKFSRKLSQTPWLIDGKRHMETSVQELLCSPIVEAAKAQDMRFSSSGREDVDVRMLGRGRPFVCELINPRVVNITPEQFRSIEKKIASSTKDVLARHLQIVSKLDIAALKLGEEEKIKIYNAYCVVLGPKAVVDWDKLNSLPLKCPIKLQQKTPIRVMHRRSLITRERLVHTIEVSRAETDEPKAFLIKIATQAGTYVKEFVHGDFGRTTPSLKDILGVEVDILSLDVDDVELNWPDEINYEQLHNN